MSKNLSGKELVLLSLVGLAALGWFVRGEYQALHDEREAASAPTRETTSPVPAETTPGGRLRAEFRRALGRSNRDMARVAVRLQGERFVVLWTINDNVTQGMRAGGARQDIRHMLEALARSTEPYTSVFFRGTFAMVDRLGNASESNVVEAVYARNTIDQINFANFLIDNVYAIAESSDIHPAFR